MVTMTMKADLPTVGILKYKSEEFEEIRVWRVERTRKTSVSLARNLDQKIYLIRGHRVMLDEDLADLHTPDETTE